MCGIIGYIGQNAAKDIVIDGLKKLEYRGYDSAGIALFNNNDAEVIKSVGKIANLEGKLNNQQQTIAIGHTRWATHGVPSESNSHPHQSSNKLITLVHNGVIENYNELKEEYLKGVEFYSETDTEVIANILEKFVVDGMTMKDALVKFIEVVDGSYALAIRYSEEADNIYFAKNKSPFLIGVGEDFNMIGSDALAMFKQTKNVVEIHDKEFGVITTNTIEHFDEDGNAISRDSYEVSIDASDADKGVFPHYMLKEIDDQPSVLRRILNEYYVDGKAQISDSVVKLFNDSNVVRLIAAGTSSYSCLVMQSLLERCLGKQVLVHIASEFVYDTPYIYDNELFVFVSQSGETADLRAALVKVKELGHKTLTVTNVEGSTLAREADDYMLLYAGREIAVASTKAYVAQLAVFATICSAFNDDIDFYSELSKSANIIESIIENRSVVEELVKKTLLNTEHCFILGRGVDYKLSLEAALKLKELSYIHADGMSSGELKHGTIALIDEGTPVFFVITQESVCKQTRSNIQEVVARGGAVSVVSMEKYANSSDDLVFDNVCDEVAPVVAIVYFQLISYYTALHLGKDIDMPRNLAKSVTVE